MGRAFNTSRLIPARAGNIVPAGAAAFEVPAHPRSRGEHHLQSAALEPRSGSSPLARGTSVAMLMERARVRLIPARAGNINVHVITHGKSPAHPRSRGEHVQGDLQTTDATGSSPLARGTSALKDLEAMGFRLIPARAGNMPVAIAS